MPLEGIRRLALGDLDEKTLRGLIAQKEHLLVERKLTMPAEPGFGAAVSSFANMLGGWVLIGVEDKTGEIHGFPMHPDLDVQSHFGQLLANQIDPPPPFVATKMTIDEKEIAVVRVFESADTPHIVRETGAVYLRTAAGKRHIKEARDLIDLARRGEDALARTSLRLETSVILNAGVLCALCPTLPSSLHVGYQYAPVEHLTIVVRAAPLTVTPQFTDWAISKAGASIAQDEAMGIATRLSTAAGNQLPLAPRGRGLIASVVAGGRKPVDVSLAIDSGGAIGARLIRSLPDGNPASSWVGKQVEALVWAVVDCLQKAEAYGRSVWHLFILMPQGIEVEGAPSTPRTFSASSELTIPAEETDQALIARWLREYARECGAADWEP